jgi:hypothetical protein
MMMMMMMMMRHRCSRDFLGARLAMDARFVFRDAYAALACIITRDYIEVVHARRSFALVNGADPARRKLQRHCVGC